MLTSESVRDLNLAVHSSVAWLVQYVTLLGSKKLKLHGNCSCPDRLRQPVMVLARPAAAIAQMCQAVAFAAAGLQAVCTSRHCCDNLIVTTRLDCTAG